MRETNKFKLGLFVIAAIVVLILSVFSMGMFDQLKPKARMVTFVDESVQGLTTGSAVKYKGVPIGNVSGITIVVDSNDIRIDIEIDLSKIQKRTQNSITGTKALGLDQFYEYLLKDTERGLACREKLRDSVHGRDTILVPTRYIDKPKYTIGLGDSFVGGVQLCF